MKLNAVTARMESWELVLHGTKKLTQDGKVPAVNKPDVPLDTDTATDNVEQNSIDATEAVWKVNHQVTFDY